jgi:hypothetical protein
MQKNTDLTGMTKKPEIKGFNCTLTHLSFGMLQYSNTAYPLRFPENITNTL